MRLSSLRIAHLSGRFDVTGAQMRAAVAALAKVSDVVTMTEVGSPELREAIKSAFLARGWRIHHPHRRGYSECLIAWAPHVPVSAQQEWLLTDKRLKTARTAPIVAVAIEVHDTWISVAHLPAHLEGASGFLKIWAAVVHASATHGWHRQLRRVGAKHRVLLADFNLNWRRPWVRTWAKARWSGLHNGWQSPLPAHGTHGARLIDWLLTNLRVRTPARLLPKLAGFDHTGFVATVGLPVTNEEHR